MAKRKSKYVADDTQLNLFGDLLNEEQGEESQEEEDGQLHRDGQESPKEVLAQAVPQVGAGGEAGGALGGRGTDGGGGASGAGERPGDETERSDGGSTPEIHTDLARDARGLVGLRGGHTDDRGNYRISVDDKIGEGGKVEKYECNVAAIRLLKCLETEGRYARPEEQTVLVKYTGWGGLSEAFKESNEGKWKERSQELKDLLGESEYRSASRSTINAHYTDPEIARRVWKAALRLGYSGGPTLEPAAGVGHFFGVRPLGVPVEMHGIEMDSISGRIAQYLYQSADIRIMPYENARMEENRYNLIISNVPFSDVKPYEDSKTRTPGLDGRYALHDFYFLKSLYGTRPGGIVAFITSRYTLDKESKEVREKIAESADFVGAIRLPNDTFKGIANTEVVTDIVFLQKRSHEQEPSELTRKFLDTAEIELEGKDGTQRVHVNQYFIDNPQFVLGRAELAGTMYRANEYTITSQSEDLYAEIDKAIQLLPEAIMSVMIENRTRELEETRPVAVGKGSEGLLNGSYVIGSDTRLYQKHPITGEI
ncbi:MAG: hypothetical protein ABSG38_12870, partial [Spirochaetia bacterium]